MSVTMALEQKLTQLKLSRTREVYAHWVKEAEAHQLGYAEFLDGLLSEELVSRQENQIRRQLKAAGFPFAATLEQFDFSLHPELKRTVIVRFFDRTFVEQAQSLILVGASGLGKTHLAIALGTKIALYKHSCYQVPQEGGFQVQIELCSFWSLFFYHAYRLNFHVFLRVSESALIETRDFSCLISCLPG